MVIGMQQRRQLQPIKQKQCRGINSSMKRRTSLLLASGRIELEEDDISVLDHIGLAFLPVSASGLHCCLGSMLFEFIKCHYLGTDEASLKVSVDNPSSLWSLKAFANNPCP